ncbi:MAG: thioredoxin domain-containing protein [Candidatus Saccharimonadales bacterium]
MSKQFAAILAAIVLVFVGALIINNNGNSSSKDTSKIAASSHTRSSTSTGVTLVEYADFQCPYCEQYFPTLEAVYQEYKDQITFQFRNFPLPNAHKNAFAAARAAEAASLKGKFWEMHDALYNPANWQVWTQANDPTVYFNQYATAIGLNAATFKTDYASSRVNDQVNADMAAGTKLGVQGTPSFFLDGKQVTIANDKAAFDKVIKAEIAKKSPQQAKPAAETTTVPPTADTTAPDATTTSN